MISTLTCSLRWNGDAGHGSGRQASGSMAAVDRDLARDRIAPTIEGQFFLSVDTPHGHRGSFVCYRWCELVGLSILVSVPNPWAVVAILVAILQSIEPLAPLRARNGGYDWDRAHPISSVLSNPVDRATYPVDTIARPTSELMWWSANCPCARSRLRGGKSSRHSVHFVTRWHFPGPLLAR